MLVDVIPLKTTDLVKNSGDSLYTLLDRSVI